MRLRAALLATTALIGFATPAAADPITILLAAGAAAAGGVATAAIAGTAIVWSAILGQAVVAGVLAGVSSLLAPKVGAGVAGPTAQDITLNRVTPVTTGMIVYGERTLGGAIVARSTTPADRKANKRYHSVLTLACHEIDGAVSAYIGETLVWTEAQYAADGAIADTSLRGQVDSAFKGKFRLRIYNGTADQAAETRYVDSAEEWTSAHRGRGIAYAYFEADFDQDVFPRGAEQIRVRIRGKKVHDPRTGATGYSTNPALHVRDYALTPELFGGIGWSAADVDDVSIVALANLADEQVPLDAGGTEDRYQYNGVLDTASSAEENLNRLSTSWGGWWTVDKGLLTVGGGAFEAATLTLTEDDMAGPIKVRARRPFEDQFNVVKALYADPEAEHVPTDLPVLDSATYQAQDNGEVLVRDLGELPGETGFARAQRLMKLALLKGRRQKMVEVPCTYDAAKTIQLGDNIMLTAERRGWTAKTFEVVGRTTAIMPGKVQVGLSLIESGPDVFDWTTSEEAPKPAGGIPTLPRPTDKPVVSAPLSTEELYETRGGGGIKTRVLLTSESENPFVDQWQFFWRLTTDPTNTTRSLTDDPTDLIDDVKPGTYIFGARARTRRGIWSDWAYSAPTGIAGLNAPPVAITGLSVQAAAGAVAMLRWDRHPSLDVQQGGKIEVRHSSALSGATWQSSTSIGKAVNGGQTEAALPLKSGTYLVRPFDALGIAGPVSIRSVKAASIIPTVVVATVLEDPGFSGSKSGCSVESGVLSTNSGVTQAVYGFSGSIDLGTVQSARLVTGVEVNIGQSSDLMWRPSSVSAWSPPDELFWASDSAFGDVDVQVRTSDDDPAGTAVWSDWQSIDAADFQARAFQFRAILTAENTEYTTSVTGLSVVAQQAA